MFFLLIACNFDIFRFGHGAQNLGTLRYYDPRPGARASTIVI